MANEDQINLQSYLPHEFVAIPVLDLTDNYRPENTTISRYNAEQIHRIHCWTSFNLDRVTAEYGHVLNNTLIVAEPDITTPARPINSEQAFRARVDAYLTNRLVRALRAGFEYLFSRERELHHTTVIKYDVGNMADMINKYIPDTAFF